MRPPFLRVPGPDLSASETCRFLSSVGIAAACEIIPIQLENQPPSILVVTLYEGAGLSIPDQCKKCSTAINMTLYKLYVSQIAELTVYLYLRNSNPARGSQDVFFGAT